MIEGGRGKGTDMRVRRDLFTVLVLTLVVSLLLLWPALSLAGGSGSVTVSARVGPCISVTSRGEVRSNVSVAAFSDDAFLTVMAR